MVDTYGGEGVDDVLWTKDFGKTYEGRDVIGYWLKGPGNPINRPTIAIDCGIHSREWISPGMAHTLVMTQTMTHSYSATCRLFINEYLRCTKPENQSTCDSYLLSTFYNYNFFMTPLLNQVDQTRLILTVILI